VQAMLKLMTQRAEEAQSLNRKRDTEILSLKEVGQLFSQLGIGHTPT
jgi:hypothetical protein